MNGEDDDSFSSALDDLPLSSLVMKHTGMKDDYSKRIACDRKQSEDKKTAAYADGRENVV